MHLGRIKKFIPGTNIVAPLVFGLAKTIMGVGQTIYGIGLGIGSLPLPCYQKDFVRQKFAFRLISHGIGNVGVGILEATPFVNTIFVACQLLNDKMTKSDEKKESFFEVLDRSATGNLLWNLTAKKTKDNYR
jgi:hypothetical protein